MTDETTSTPDPILSERRAAQRMLHELYRLAEHASLTGAFSRGAVEAVSAYNLILGRMTTLGIDTTAYFQPLTPEASFDQVAVAAKLLGSFLDDEAEEPRRRNRRDGNDDGVHVMVGRHGRHFRTDDIEELGRIKDIGQIIRDSLPDFLKEEKKPKPEAES